MDDRTDTTSKTRRRHNEYCWAALSDPARANELLRLFMEAGFRALLADDPPKVAATRHTGEGLKSGEMDFNFLFRLKQGGFFKFFLEHKSWSDLRAPGQLLKYLQMAVNSRAQDDVRLIAFAALFHGPGEWTAPFAVEWPEAVGARYPANAFCYPLWNLMKLDLEALPLSDVLRMALAAMVGAFRRAEQETLLEPILDTLLTLRDRDPLFATQTMEYISGAWETDWSELQDRLMKLQPKKEGKTMGMTAWELEDRGEARGLAKGRAEGKAEGKAEALLTLLRLKFGRLAAGVTRRVQSASAAQLDAWTAAVLTAATLDEALATKPKH